MRDVGPSPESNRHLGPALVAVILAAALLVGFRLQARSVERRVVRALAADDAVVNTYGEWFRLKNQGTALQEAAFTADDLLPVYGSSELGVLRGYNRPFHLTRLFREHDAGFRVFPMGKEATTCLIMLQKLAAVGPAMRGRKVAISMTPNWFFEGITAWDGGYVGNFSPLHAGEVAFNTRISLGLRRDAARRMLQYPETVKDRPLLRFALESLADGSAMGLACYEAALPLGLLYTAILRDQDHRAVVAQQRSRPIRTGPSDRRHAGPPPDWAALQQQALACYREHSNKNEYGLDNQRWENRFREETLRQRGTRTDEAFLRTLRDHQEWVDLELLLRTLSEFGARPMLLSMPIHGPWYEQCGVTYAARRVYYERLREVGARYGAAVVNFADHDDDRTFCFDYKGHLSPCGWVQYGKALDGFFHGTALPRRDLPGPATVGGGRAPEGRSTARTTRKGSA